MKKLWNKWTEWRSLARPKLEVYQAESSDDEGETYEEIDVKDYLTPSGVWRSVCDGKVCDFRQWLVDPECKGVVENHVVEVAEVMSTC